MRSSRSLQILAIFGFWAAGQVLVDLTHVPVPGSIIGLFILLSLLLSRKLSIHTVRHGAFWYLGEMLLFFIPALVAVLDHPEFLGTRWLVTLSGPATVAFAVPIYEQQKLIRRQWFLLIVATLVGSAVAILSSRGLAMLFRFDDSLRRSLLLRSFSMPFALPLSADIGGVPALTALFVLITGVTGAAVAKLLLCWLPLRSVLARGALFGMGAHAIGAAKARLCIRIRAICAFDLSVPGVVIKWRCCSSAMSW